MDKFWMIDKKDGIIPRFKIDNISILFGHLRDKIEGSLTVKFAEHNTCKERLWTVKYWIHEESTQDYID